MHLTLRNLASPQRGSALVLAAACFAAGLAAGAVILPVGAGRIESSEPVRREPPVAALRGGHPAEVLRVLDGDTFEAKVRIWPGMEVTTRVRLRGIDAPEMSARCDDERLKAVAARDALAKILGEGTVGVSRIGQDKYGGRVDVTHAGRFRGVARSRTGAALFRRPPRQLVFVGF